MKNIAKWDGNSWKALGNGTDEGVKAIAIDRFGNICVNNSSGIVKWDGNSWSSIGNLKIRSLDAMVFDRMGNLYAGGEFKDGETVNYLVKWDSKEWSKAGGMNGNVFAMIVDRFDNLYAGGSFTMAGGKVSAHVAQCKLNNIPIRPQLTGNQSRPSITFDSRTCLLRLSLQSATEVHCSIFTLDGRQVFHGSKLMNKGNSTLRLKNVGKIARGTYVAKVNAGNESVRFRMMVER